MLGVVQNNGFSASRENEVFEGILLDFGNTRSPYGRTSVGLYCAGAMSSAHGSGVGVPAHPSFFTVPLFVFHVWFVLLVTATAEVGKEFVHGW